MRYAYGICNVAYFNLRPEGDEIWFPTRKARNLALRAIREIAVDKGLAQSASVAGIYPIKRHVASDIGEAWLREVQDGRPGLAIFPAGAPIEQSQPARKAQAKRIGEKTERDGGYLLRSEWI